MTIGFMRSIASSYWRAKHHCLTVISRYAKEVIGFGHHGSTHLPLGTTRSRHAPRARG